MVTTMAPIRSDSRAPKMMRDSTQRPRPSVPSGNCESPPASQNGGSRLRFTSWAIGSFGAIHGAKIAR